MKKITIAIDGFSSCGKSTMAKDLAREIGYIYIDSGAMYRAVTLYSMENGIFTAEGIDTEKLKKQINSIRISFQLNPETGRPDTYLNGINVEKKIRTMEVSSRVSPRKWAKPKALSWTVATSALPYFRMPNLRYS